MGLRLIKWVSLLWKVFNWGLSFMRLLIPIENGVWNCRSFRFYYLRYKPWKVKHFISFHTTVNNVHFIKMQFKWLLAHSITYFLAFNRFLCLLSNDFLSLIWFTLLRLDSRIFLLILSFLRILLFLYSISLSLYYFLRHEFFFQSAIVSIFNFLL